jgi:hypothetical protein
MIPEIVFPMGLGGNHVRWLLSLDPKFDLKCCYSNKLEDKVKWICNNVYTKRTWNTWLTKEWHYRGKLDSSIGLAHFLPNISEVLMDTTWQRKKQLLLRADDYTTIGYHYFMVNLGLNNQTLSVVLDQFKDWETSLEKVKNCNLASKTILTSDCISEPTLNQEWYQKIVAWAGYDDLYEHANQIHALYYQARQQAAQDFVNYFKSSEFQTHLDFYKNIYITS